MNGARFASTLIDSLAAELRRWLATGLCDRIGIMIRRSALRAAAAIAALIGMACHRPSVGARPLMYIYPDPVISRGTVLDEARAATHIAAMRVCVHESWIDAIAALYRDSGRTPIRALPGRPVSVRVTPRGGRRLLFGSDAGGADQPCVLLEMPAGAYDLWVADDGPIPITTRAGYIDSVVVTINLPITTG